MFPRGPILIAASRTMAIFGGDAAMKTSLRKQAGKCYAVGLPDFPWRLSRFRLSNLPDEARFAANRTV